jgi:hypothetical protein
VRISFGAFLFINILYQRHEKSAWLAMGILDPSDFLGFLCCFNHIYDAGDVCTGPSAEEGELIIIAR